MRLVFVHFTFELLDVLLFGLVYVTWALHNFFVRIARLFVADGSAPQRGKGHRIITRRTYVECFQGSDLPLSKGSNARAPSRAVFRSASGLEEGIGSCAGIHIARLSINEHRLALAQRSAACTIFFRKMRVSRVSANRLCVIETGVVMGVSNTAFLALITPVRFTQEIRKRETHRASLSARPALTFPSRCTTVSPSSSAEAARR